MKKPRKKVVPVLGGALEITVNIAGKGKPLLYLHSAGGYYWDDFLDGLADHYKVYVPHFPGTAPGKPNEIDGVDNLWDTVTAYDDLLDGLGLKKVRLMGHSFGGLLAAELAAHRPKAIEKLVLISPIGLWREDAPYTVANWCALDDKEIMDALFYDKTHPFVVKRMTPPAGKDAAALWQVHFIWTLGCTAKVIWPIPDKGLRKRIHRITAPTLVVWGENDKLIPPVYAQEFGKALANAEVVMLPQCGHEPPLEQCAMLTKRVGDFLAA
ncbi:MAG: alpha/beta hydrolase [Gammaproteobacteria bacterium]|nr:alpha/beta hydrolase [Gammaproteobacteria bacterium]